MLPHELHEAILQTVRDMYVAVADYRQLAIQSAIADDSYKQAKASRYAIETAGTVPERNMQIEHLTQVERSLAMKTKAAADGQYEFLSCKRAELSALQTLASVLKAEMSISGKGGET